jgi:hypothetical protein
MDITADRAGFKTQSLAEISQWPPLLHFIPQSPILWAEFTRNFLEAKGFFLAVLALGHLSL